MSTYSKISKRIGWDPICPYIPGRKRVMELIEQIKQGDEDAFETIFTIHRFASSEALDLAEVADLVAEGFKIGTLKFSND